MFSISMTMTNFFTFFPFFETAPKRKDLFTFLELACSSSRIAYHALHYTCHQLNDCWAKKSWRQGRFCKANWWFLREERRGREERERGGGRYSVPPPRHHHLLNVRRAVFEKRFSTGDATRAYQFVCQSTIRNHAIYVFSSSNSTFSYFNLPLSLSLCLFFLLCHTIL